MLYSNFFYYRNITKMSQKIFTLFQSVNYAICKKDMSILTSFLTIFEWLICLIFFEFFFKIQIKNDLILYWYNTLEP